MKFQKKIYLSRAQTRAMAMDHPIGDPTGGAAYGERNDPVSAVVAVATMAMTYEAAFVAGSVAAGMMFAGAAMSLVGNATGNKDLQMLGTVVGLAGGVGSLANLGEAAAGSTVSEGAIQSANASGDAIESLNASQGWTSTGGAEAATGAQAADASASQAIVGDANPNVTVNAAPAETIAPPAQLADTTGLAAGANPALSSAPAPVDATGATSVMYDDGSSALMNPNGSFVDGSVQAAPDSAFGAGGPQGTPYSTWDKLKAGVGNMMPDTSKMSTMDKLIATKIGSDVVGGIVNYVAPSPQQQAQTEAQRAQANLANAQTDKLKAEQALRDQRIANLNRNMQMGLGIGSNQDAVAINQPKPGLIQSQMRLA